MNRKQEIERGFLLWPGLAEAEPRVDCLCRFVNQTCTGNKVAR